MDYSTLLCLKSLSNLASIFMKLVLSVLGLSSCFDYDGIAKIQNLATSHSSFLFLQPLEGSSKASPGSAQAQQHSAAATARTTVPCYFYFNAFCMKGDQCPFSHAVEGTPPAQKAPKAGSREISNGPAADDLPLKPTEDARDMALQEVNPSRESLGPSSSDDEGSVSDRSSEGPGEDPAEAEEERWESSPGFDVLVDDGSEQPAYEDDGDHLQAAQETGSEAALCSQFIRYDYDGSADFASDRRPCEGYDGFDDGYAADCAEGDEDQMPYERTRRHPPMHRDEEPRGGVDLRDHLRKRRRVDFHHAVPLGSPRGMPSEPAWEESWRTAGGPRYPCYGRQREGRERRRERLERRPSPNGRIVEPTTFSLMKDQLHQGRPRSKNRRGELTSADFEGPKPLSELLKDKRRSTPRCELASVGGHGRESSGDEEEDDLVGEREKKVAGILA